MTMKVAVYNLEGNVAKRVKVPNVFRSPIRPDVVRRVVVALQSHRFQPQGRDVMAGKRTTAESWGVGYGRARIPRVKGERHPKAGAGAFAPGTVGGRRAHPPVVKRDIRKTVNKKERKLALRSAIAATAKKDLVTGRGHVVEKVLRIPLVVVDDLQGLKKTADVKRVLTILGLWPDVERVKRGMKERAGKGKMRGRRLKIRKGPLIVIERDEGIRRAASSVPGVDVVNVSNLNAEVLAPGTHIGRLTLWTESALEKLDELFGD